MKKKRQNIDFEGLPVDLNNMPSMGELLGENSIDPIAGDHKPEPRKAKGHSNDHRQIISIKTNDMPSMDDLLASNPEYTNPQNVEEDFDCGRGRRYTKTGRSGLGNQDSNRLINGNIFVLDGSNICRSFLDLDGASSLAPLLTLVTVLVRHGGEFRCIFDANERYVMADNLAESGSERVYDGLLRRLSRYFIEVPGASNADDYILATAERGNSLIISNDRYSKPEDNHLRQYPWLQFGTKRIIRGMAEHGMLTIDSLSINVPLDTDLENQADALIDYLS